MPLYITILYLFCGGVTTLIGSATLIKNSKSSAHLSYAFFTASVLIWLICMYFGYYLGNESQWYEGSLFFIRGAYASSFLLGISLCAFFYYFPKKTLHLPNPLLVLFATATGGLISIALFTPLIEKALIFQDGVLYGDEFGPWYPIYVWYFLGSLGVAILLGIQKIYATQGLERKKVLVAAFTCWIFLFLGVTTNVVLPLWNIFIFQLESPTFSLIFIIPAFYAMHKYRFFNFSYTSLQIIRWLLLSASFTAVYLCMEYLLTNTLAIFESPELIIEIISILIALVALKKMESVFPLLLPQSFRDFQNKLHELQSNIYYCKSYQELSKHIEKSFVVDLNFSYARVYLIRDKEGQSTIPIYLRDELTTELSQNKKTVIITSELNEKETSQKIISQRLKSKEASICLPLYLEQRVIGVFLLGNKESGEYNQEEVNELLNIRSLLEICFINILLQSDLKEENDLMKKVINERTASLKQQNEEIKKMVRQQSDFIAVTAHEFRTPLNIALLQLDDTLDSYQHSEQVLDDMKILENSLSRLKELTQNLFDVQQYDLEKVQLEKEKVNLGKYLTEIYEESRELMTRNEQNFTIEIKMSRAATAEVDTTKTRQVLHNLLSNAMKFSPKGGQISLVLSDTEHSISIEIRDTGIGIPDTDKPRIFEKFQTADAKKGMGIGMGLYLCKKIIELHHWEIRVSDNIPKGTIFTILIPKEKTAEGIQ